MKKHLTLLIFCMIILTACGKANISSDPQDHTESSADSTPISAGETPTQDESKSSLSDPLPTQSSSNQTSTITSIPSKPVVVPVTGVKLSKSSLTLDIGGTDSMTATVSPNNATDRSIRWTSDNDSIATVDSGVVTAISTGVATITATADEKSASCTVTVKPPKEKSVYDRPYDIAGMEKDMEQYVKSKGKNYSYELNLDFFGTWSDPLYTSSRWYGEKLEKSLKSQMDFCISRDYPNYRMYCLPLGDGEFKIHLICG